MTTEEFNSIKWRLVGHLSMSSTRYSVYVGVYNGITIMMQTAIRVLKNGGYGKTKVAYFVGQREFKTKEELIKYLNELTQKGDGAMRTIKFRGKTHGNGKWYYGSLVYSEDINTAIYFQTGNGLVKTMDWVYVIPETIGQFTGLKDKNGEWIYEGDILKWDKDGLLYVVRFWHGMFYASVEECNDGILGGFPLHALTEYEYKKCKIVGNIYDNPELLKGGEK